MGTKAEGTAESGLGLLESHRQEMRESVQKSKEEVGPICYVGEHIPYRFTPCFSSCRRVKTKSH